MASRAAPFALITCQQHPLLPEDDRRLLTPLQEAGFEPSILCWDDPAVDWTAFSLVVLRAPWDYYLKYTAFLRWLEARERQGARVFNPASAVRWNADKRYLLELSAQGIPVVETELIEPGAPRSLGAVLAARGWEEAVLKPSISAGAHQTARLARGQAAAHQGLLEAILARGSAALVQPYLPEVAEAGEWSLLYFNRRFSHAVQKVPAAGDFRVQAEFGGQTRLLEPPPSFLATAERVLQAVEGPLLYARVDGIPRAGRLLISELEIIEPSLFLELAPEAPRRFVEALSALTNA